jgi:hypothetical protein
MFDFTERKKWKINGRTCVSTTDQVGVALKGFCIDNLYERFFLRTKESQNIIDSHRFLFSSCFTNFIVKTFHLLSLQ